MALAMIAHVQVVVEKLAGQHGGPRRRRQAITYLETLKAVSRLLLLACTKEMVMGGGAVRALSCCEACIAAVPLFFFLVVKLSRKLPLCKYFEREGSEGARRFRRCCRCESSLFR